MVHLQNSRPYPPPAGTDLETGESGSSIPSLPFQTNLFPSDDCYFILPTDRDNYGGEPRRLFSFARVTGDGAYSYGDVPQVENVDDEAAVSSGARLRFTT